ncbi:MAG TPA: hypothetical protein VEG84_05835 [Thermoanaerobaculia bacterium]|nr:hypothetical protein [Thermoanaerobaculia bacterium]
MWRVAVFLALLFFILMMLRALRQLLESFFSPPSRPRTARREVAGEMVRDPVCGTWIDRRLALPAGRGNDSVSVCSEECRHALEVAAR